MVGLTVGEIWPPGWSAAVLPFVTLSRVAGGGQAGAEVARAIVEGNVLEGGAGQVLGALRALEDENLVTRRFRGGREEYVLTESGRLRLESWRTRWAQFVSLVNGMTNG